MLNTLTREEMFNLYLNAYRRGLEEFKVLHDSNSNQDFKDIYKKIVFTGVRTVIFRELPYEFNRETVQDHFNFIDSVMRLIGHLTPNEFEQLFPINKKYDGKKYGCKDYYFTKDYIKEIGADKPVGEKAFEFLWNYQNWDITDFQLKLIECMDYINKFDGHLTFAEKMAQDMGLRTYTHFTDKGGKHFLVDSETGKTKRIKAKVPKHLKVCK